MAKAILIPLEYANPQDVFNCLKTYHLLLPNTTLISTPSNQSISMKLSNTLKAKQVYNDDFNSSESLKAHIENSSQAIYIEKSHLLIDLLQKLMPMKGERDFAGIGYSLIITSNDEWEETELKFENFPEYFSDGDDGEDPLDKERNLNIVNCEWIDYCRRSSETQARNLEVIQTNTILTSLVLKDVQKKVESVNKFMQRNKGVEAPEIDNCGKIAQKIKQTSLRIKAIEDNSRSIQLEKNDFKADLKSIDISHPTYEEGMIEWTHEKSADNSSHLFLIENKTKFNVENTALFCSESQLKINEFSVEPFELKHISQDFMVDELKNQGFLEFDLFYCCFKLANTIKVYAVKILSIERTGSDGMKFKVNFENFVTSFKQVYLMNNDVVKTKLAMKNYEKSSVVFALNGEFKGEIHVNFQKDNKVLSNTEKIVV